jgi:hypothetical protein
MFQSATVPISVLVPTRNRPMLLSRALASIARSDFVDMEVVVSDNSSSELASEVRELVQASGLPGLRYLRPDHEMAMGDHWDWAVRQLGGEFITVLCDDDAMAPDDLSRALRVLKEHGCDVVCETAVAYWDGSLETPRSSAVPVEAPALMGRPAKDRVRLLDARASLAATYRYLHGGFNPIPQLSVLRRTLVEEVARRSGRVFLNNHAPDLAFAASVLFLVDRYAWLESPGRVMGVTSQSIGATRMAPGGVAAEFTEHVADAASEHLPLGPVRLPTNLMVGALLQAKEAMGVGDGAMTVSPAAFLRYCLADISEAASNGWPACEIESAKAAVERYKASLGFTDRIRVLVEHTVETRAKAGAVPFGMMLRSYRASRRLLSARRGGAPYQPPGDEVWMSAHDLGIGDIVEVAERMPEIRRLLSAAVS